MVAAGRVKKVAVGEGSIYTENCPCKVNLAA